nr:immunoglobulin light chain junction region [Macaca mulatta]MOV80241.1 immunoglobulin light chain junction region [Macaca mulatta]MOV81070.1 immunoglobulin light chain junction region [Macaca mulatta]MOV82061.1 immunoglobulin light chain junction region [Macaca mulatta]MOV84254.1 immunoglobulin light chain junction region [Macaca mulatta]
CQQGYSYPFTF